jgi:hypothetical protein
MDQEYVEKMHLPAGVAFEKNEVGGWKDLDRRSQPVPHRNHDITGKGLTCANRTPYLTIMGENMFLR